MPEQNLNLVRSGQPTTKLHSFLMRTAELLHRYGTPSHRLERVMTKVSQTLGVRSVFLYTPTALIASLSDGDSESTYMRRVDSGAVEVDKLIRFDEVLENLEAKKITIDQADQQMHDIDKMAPPYTVVTTGIICGIACGCVAVFLSGGYREVMWAMIFGMLIAALDWVQSKLQWERGLLEPVAGFLAALGSLAVDRWVHPIDDRLLTLAALVILLPGLSLTVAMTELAVGHLSAGVARLAGAFSILLTLVLGVVLAWKIGDSWHQSTAILVPLPGWMQWGALAIAPLTFAVLVRARWPQWPIIFAVSCSGYLAAKAGGAGYGAELGAFLGALVVGSLSNLYARIRNRPALVPLTPGMIILVPGSIGYQSLTAMSDFQTLQGVRLAFSMLMVAMCLVGGLLAAGVLVPTKRIL
jgi:uncharacterized membrane protein YjjP (DUF1212 family)